jgi:hypothetical protein
MSDLSVFNALSRWRELVHPKNENIYKRELLIEKKSFCIEVGAFTFPVARRVMANTIGNDLVSVQPMEPPTGIFHYIDSTEHEDLYKRVLLIETYKKPLSRRSRRRSGRRFQDSFINKI